MKKTIKHSVLTAISGLLLFIQPSLLQAANSGDVVNAINKMKTAVISALHGSSSVSVVSQLKANNRQITSLFDTTFKGSFNPITGKLVKLGTLDEKINLYSKNFYAWFTTEDFESLDFSKKMKKNREAIEKLQSQNIGYNYEKSLLGKIADQKALLAQPVENPANNFSGAIIGVKKNSNPYGSLDNKTPTAKNAPTVADLLGPDSYSNKEERNRAKLFINYIMSSVPSPKNIRIPDKKEAINNKVTIYFPYQSKNKPYTTATVSTKSKGFGGNSPFSSFTSNDSDYDKMKTFLEQDFRFQTLKQKMRANNTLRTLYLEALMQAYQSRAIDTKKKDDKSLAEQEKELALEGLDKEYYEGLKKKSVADVNLETLKSIKTLTYFMWKLHKDNELNALMIGASGLRLATSDVQDESQYIKPVSTLIKNRCWDIDKNTSKKRKEACKNPMTSSFKPNMED